MLITTMRAMTLYADSFNIPPAISRPLIRDFKKWVECSGEEWTVSRMKSLKLDFIRLKAGLPVISTWISKNSHGDFSGPIGGLLSFCKRRRKNFSKVIQMLDIYTTLYAGEITDSQRKKFLDGVNSEPVDVPADIRQGVLSACVLSHIQRFWISDPKPLGTYTTSTTRQPLPSGKSVPDSVGHLISLDYLDNTPLGLRLRDEYASIFDPLLLGVKMSYTFVKQWEMGPVYKDSVGKIGVIQEAGYKLRAVANPGRVYQDSLKPLGDCLYDILRDLPWDCTHNQGFPLDIVQNHLRNGHVSHAVDLSGATDYFPLQLQMDVLKYVSIRTDYPSLFEELAKAPWIFEKSTISWKKGQPLGLYPSFAIFALTHGLLLYYLNNFRHENKFFVLGDDVVILDNELYRKYRECLLTLQCPVSENKTLCSNLLTEFAGKIITRDSIIPQLKWRNPSDDNFIDLVRNIGHRSLRLLLPRQRKVVKALWDIPDLFGGVGFNPKGLPLEERYFKYLSLFGKDKSAQFLMSYNKLLNLHNYYEDVDNLSRRYSYVPTSDLDQRSYSLVQKLLPNLVNWYEVLGKNLYTMDSGLPLLIDAVSKRYTKLEQLEKVIRT